MKDIFSLGIKFFLIQLTALIMFQTNNFIIAHACSLGDVAEFNIAYRYMGILQIAFTAILTPLWSASTDAYARGDIQWIKNAIKKINHLWMGLIFAGIAMVLLSPAVYKIWLGDSLSANTLLLSLCMIYFIAYTKDSTYRMFINGTGKIRLQFAVTSIQSTLHIPLSIILGKHFGIEGVLFSMILWQLINCIWEPYQYYLIINRKAEKIWNK